MKFQYQYFAGNIAKDIDLKHNSLQLTRGKGRYIQNDYYFFRPFDSTVDVHIYI